MHYHFFFLISFLLASSFLRSEQAWIVPGKPTYTIFCQGIFASQTQFSKICGKRGFIATTGQNVTCPDALDNVYGPFIEKDLDEIQLHTQKLEIKPFSFGSLTELAQFVIAILTNQQEKLWHWVDEKDYNYNIELPKTGSNEDVRYHSMIAAKVNFAQDGDIRNHKKNYDALLEYESDCNIIAYGISRGASATFTACAQNGYENVKLVVLEGCYDTLENAIKGRFPVLKKSKRLSNFIVSMIAKITSWKPNGIEPITCVEEFPEHTPVVFIHSEKDKNVPIYCAKTLAQKLKNKQKNPVWFLSLKNSSHSGYHKDDTVDRTDYHNLVHAVYKKYDLPYIEEYAQAGQELLKSCYISTGYQQPTQ